MDPERGRPVPAVDEIAADGRAEADAEPADGGPDGDRLRSFFAIERIREDRERRG